MLSEPALALTDLVLGAVTLILATRLRHVDGLHRAWLATFWWMGASAIAGFVHHGWVTFSESLAGPSFAVVTTMVVVAVTFLLAASVAEALGPGQRRVFVVLRLVTIGGYVALAAAGRAGATSILLAESVAMATIVVLWIVALHRRHRLAPRVITAFVVSGLAAIVYALPADSRYLGLDPASLYHLAQIPGVVLLYVALTSHRHAVEKSLGRAQPSWPAAHLYSRW